MKRKAQARCYADFGGRYGRMEESGIEILEGSSDHIFIVNHMSADTTVAALARF